MDHRFGKKAITIPAYTSEWEGELPLFFLDGLLPVDEALSVNTDCLIVSLVLTNSTSGNPILRQRLLTESQMRLLLTLLQSPHYCPHEVLYAGLFCSFQGLLAGLFSSEHIAREEWLTAIRETASLLEHASCLGKWRKELKQLYNSLSELRAKLRPLCLGISISNCGSAYALIPLPPPQQEVYEPGKISPYRLPLKTANLHV
jgi:hypothetical protein